jgi:hypothetical protein
MWAPLLESPRHGVVLSISDSLSPGLTKFVKNIWSLLDRLNGTIISVHFQVFMLLGVNSARNVGKSPSVRFLV